MMMMKPWGVVLFFLLRAWIAASNANKGPPRLLGPSSWQQTVREGDDVKLVCPIDANPPPIVEWTKDGETVTKEWERLRASGRSLRLRQSSAEDSGLYLCKGVNGFGREEASIRLHVLGSPEEGQQQPKDQSSPRLLLANLSPHPSVVEDESEEGEEDEGDDDEVQDVHSSIPRLTRVTLTQSPFLQRPLGATLNLRCQAVGSPRPQVTWLKNGQQIDMARVSTGVRDGSTLLLRNLNPRDAGVYTCRAWNLLGETNFDIRIEVVGRKPELEGVHPINTTVQEGQTAYLQCTVRSTSQPHIDWLKQVEQGESGIIPFSANQSTLEIGGVRFRVLRGGNEQHMQQTSDGLFLHRLIIPRATLAHSGKYVCVGANNQGYSFREAFLTVIPHVAGRNSRPGDTFSLIPLLVLPAVILILGVLVLAGVRWQLKRSKMASAAGTSAPPNSTATEAPTRGIQMAWSPGPATHNSQHQHQHQKAPLLLARNNNNTPHCGHLQRAGSNGSGHGRTGHHHHHHHHHHHGGAEAEFLPLWARSREPPCPGQHHVDLIC